MIKKQYIILRSLFLYRYSIKYNVILNTLRPVGVVPIYLYTYACIYIYTTCWPLTRPYILEIGILFRHFFSFQANQKKLTATRRDDNHRKPFFTYNRLAVLRAKTNAPTWTRVLFFG